jgi:positive regulator of sigma E activity
VTRLDRMKRGSGIIYLFPLFFLFSFFFSSGTLFRLGVVLISGHCLSDILSRSEQIFDLLL